MTDIRFNGKVALVGGGAKNLGGLISRQLAAEGAKVVVHFNSDSTKADADKTLADIKKAGGEAILVQGDLTKPANVVALFDAAIKAFGGVDIAINTTGMVLKKPIAEVTESDYDTMFAVNSKAAFFFIQEAGKRLRDRGKICTLVSSLLAAYTDSYAVYPAARPRSSITHARRARSLALVASA